ncbi:hypothetical protein JXA48_05015 [Candidatus Woesearchaeota archaeon]|nr:hypothetical protein [Candidatus Woesearchaeota archaeon]
MVLISRKQRDFNDDMGAYLANRNSRSDSESGSFFKKVDSLIPIKKVFSPSSDKDVPHLSNAIESTVYEQDENPSFFSRIIAMFSSSSSPRDLDEEIDDFPEDIQEEIHEIEDELDDVEHEVEELEEKRESLIKRFFSIFRSNRSSVEEEMPDFEHSHDVELDPAEVLKAETRQTLKIIHKWISRLPPEQIDAFKRSPDFNRYKELLEKYNLLK